MAVGLYRRRDGWVQALYDGRYELPIPVELYQTKGYEPPLDALPAEDEYKAANRKAEDDAQGT